MVANYHTHTPRCRHAEGSERAYARAALDAGLRVLGFSDHTPYRFPGGYESSFRMRPEELDGYCRAVLAVREEYRGRLDIRLGLEAEYYPALFPWLRARLRETPVEYLILGQHFIGNEVGDFPSSRATADPALLRRYTDQIIEGMETGCFSCVAHPDLLHFIGDEAVYAAEARRLCRAANARGVPLEINLLGMAGGRHYPNERFWRIAGAEGCTVVLGCDAHTPSGLDIPRVEAAGRALAARCGITLADTIPLRAPV